MTRGRRLGALGRYTPLLRDPSDPDGGWVEWDSHRDRVCSWRSSLIRRSREDS